MEMARRLLPPCGIMKMLQGYPGNQLAISVTTRPRTPNLDGGRRHHPQGSKWSNWRTITEVRNFPVCNTTIFLDTHMQRIPSAPPPKAATGAVGTSEEPLSLLLQGSNPCTEIEMIFRQLKNGGFTDALAQGILIPPQAPQTATAGVGPTPWLQLWR